MGLSRQGSLGRVFGSSGAPPPDQEKGLASGESAGDSVDSRRRSVKPIDPGDLVPSTDKLLVFRTLTGIDTVPVVASSGHTSRTARNIGIYARVVRNERRAKKSYRIVKALTVVCMAIQIIFGAAVTALGASRGSYGAVTALGAAGTIVGSFVAFVKGKGQPEKLGYAENRWRLIRQYIEQRERELCLIDCELDVYEEAYVIEQMYRTVKEELDSDKIPGQSNQSRDSVGGIPTGAPAGPGMPGPSAPLRRKSTVGSSHLRNAEAKVAAGLDKIGRVISEDPDGEDKTPAVTAPPAAAAAAGATPSTGKHVCEACKK